MSNKPLIATHELTKRFGELLACDGVNVALDEGEIVALLGENGAGKSTFVKMLFGALQPTSGWIAWRGERVPIPEPATARRLGIGMVHQHFSLFEAFTCAENIALGLGTGEPLAAIASRARAMGERYGLPIDPDALVADLAIGQRQRVEIVRCLLQDPALVIMDEPTSVLTAQEAEGLFDALRLLRSEGRTVLYISHKLEEVRALCERAVVMRAGRVVEECDPRLRSAGELASAMIGGEVPTIRHERLDEPGEALLEVLGLSRASELPFGTPLRDVELEVRAGEIVGIAGIAGNGQRELFAAISGETLSERDAVRIAGEGVGHLGIDARRSKGAAFVPEERLGHGTAPGMTLDRNFVLSRHGKADGTRGPLGWLRWGKGRRAMREIVERMDVRMSAPNPPARRLSGGNLQKFVVGRELDAKPKLLVVDQPTWGVDAGAASNIRQALIDLASGGVAVLVISQDLDELFEIADRLAVMNGGRLGSLRPTTSYTREMVGLEMGGTASERSHAA